MKDFNFSGEVYKINGTGYGIDDANDLQIDHSEAFERLLDDIVNRADRIDLSGNIELFQGPEEETEEEIEWEEPLPFNNYEVYPIPSEVFPDWQQDFIKNLSDFMQVDESMPAMLMLSVTATALANKAVIQVKPGWEEPLNIWTCSILPPAERKSPVFKKMQKPLIDYEQREAERVEQDRKPLINEKSILEDRLDILNKKAAKTNDSLERQSLIQDVNDLQGEIDDIYIPPIPRLTASDITSEAVAKLMAQNAGRFSVLDPEGTIFKIMAGHYSGNPDLKNFKKGWTGSEPIGDDRMTREGNKVSNPALTMGVTTQPSVFDTLKHTEQFVGEGIFARTLFCIPERMAGKRLTGDDCPDFRQDIYDKYKRGLMVLLNAKPKDQDKGEWEQYTIKLTNKAKKSRVEFTDYVEERLGENGEFHFMQGWGGKIVGNTTRIAGLLEIAARVDPESGAAIDLSAIEITEESMKNAIKIGHALISHSKKLHGELDMNPNIKLAKYILGRIMKGVEMEQSGELKEKYDKTAFDKSMLHTLCKGKKKIQRPKDLNQPLRILEESNYIMRVGRESSGGRPPTDLIILNPKVYALNTLNTLKPNSNDISVD
ncbi:MAG: YfjI family protein, partial [Halarsenatibacteraceae bacterium]